MSWRSACRFIVRTPEDFLEFTRAREPDPETGQPDMEKVGAFLGEHPEALPAIQATLGTDPPESYATVAYNSIHAYRWIDGRPAERWVRYRFEPEAGEATLGEEEARERGADYLQEEIASRESAAFRMLVVIAGARGSPRRSRLRPGRRSVSRWRSAGSCSPAPIPNASATATSWCSTPPALPTESS